MLCPNSKKAILRSCGAGIGAVDDLMNNKNKIIQKLAMPSAAKLIEEKKIDINTIIGTGVDGRVTKGDVLLHLNLINNLRNLMLYYEFHC